MAILLKTASVRVSFIQIIQVRVQNKGKNVWKSRYDGDVSIPCKLNYIEQVILFCTSCMLLFFIRNPVVW